MNDEDAKKLAKMIGDEQRKVMDESHTKLRLWAASLAVMFLLWGMFFNYKNEHDDCSTESLNNLWVIDPDSAQDKYYECRIKDMGPDEWVSPDKINY